MIEPTCCCIGWALRLLTPGAEPGVLFIHPGSGREPGPCVYAYSNTGAHRLAGPAPPGKIALMVSNAAPRVDALPATAASRLWPRLKRWLVPAFGVLVLGLLISHAHK